MPDRAVYVASQRGREEKEVPHLMQLASRHFERKKKIEKVENCCPFGRSYYAHPTYQNGYLKLPREINILKRLPLRRPQT